MPFPEKSRKLVAILEVKLFATYCSALVQAVDMLACGLSLIYCRKSIVLRVSGMEEAMMIVRKGIAQCIFYGMFASIYMAADSSSIIISIYQRNAFIFS